MYKEVKNKPFYEEIKSNLEQKRDSFNKPVMPPVAKPIMPPVVKQNTTPVVTPVKEPEKPVTGSDDDIIKELYKQVDKCTTPQEVKDFFLSNKEIINKNPVLRKYAEIVVKNLIANKKLNLK